MPTVYNGNGSLVTSTVGPAHRQVITSSTNTAPIVVDVTAHGYNTGDTVAIEGHATNTAANGLWQITVTGANTFSLNGSTGNGVGGATGYATDYELQPAIVIPAGGELVDPGVIGAALEGVSNTAPYLYRAAGAFNLYDIYSNGLWQNDQSLAWTSSTPGNNTWALVTGCSSLLAPGIAGSGGVFSSGNGYSPSVQNGDVLDIKLSMTAQVTGSTAASSICSLAMKGLWTSAATGPANSNVNAVTLRTELGSGSPNYYSPTLPIVLCDRFLINGVTGPGGTLDMQLWAKGTNGTVGTLYLYGNWEIIVKHYRRN
jgi:hypothetical protein